MNSTMKILIALVAAIMLVAPSIAVIENPGTTLGIITQPTEGMRIASQNVYVSYLTGGWTIGNYAVDDVEYVCDPCDGTPIDLEVLEEGEHNVKIYDTEEPRNILGEVNFIVDVTPPEEVSSVTHSSTQNSITWSWTNPDDMDFNNVILTVWRTDDPEKTPLTEYNGIERTGDPGDVDSITVTGLYPNTGYTIRIQTEDTAETQPSLPT